MYNTYMAIIWDITGTYWGLVWDMSGICLGHVWNMSGTYPGHVCDMSGTDLLKVNSFAQAEFSDCKLCAQQWALNAIKTCETLRNFVKLYQNYKKVPVFPVLRSKIQILRKCSKILGRRASARLQLLEAL